VLFLTDGRIVGRLDEPSAEGVAARMTHLDDERQPQPATAGGR
jgi:hypothetical protein